MYKQLILTVVMLALINTGTGFASEGYDLNLVKTGISRIEACKAKISSLENSLSGLKIDSRANMWNFIGRSGNEKIIQKRSRIVREISSVNEEIFSISSELIKSRAAMHAGLADGLKDEAFRQALVYLDGLALAEALVFNFMDPKAASSGEDIKDKPGFLRYRHEQQAKKLKDWETLAAQFKAAQKACEALNLAAEAAAYGLYIDKLGKKQDEGQKSQAAIINYLI